MDLWLSIVLAVAGLAVGTVVGILIRRALVEKKTAGARSEAERILQDADKKAEAIKKERLLEAKEEILRQRNESEAELKERRSEVTRMERRLTQKEETLDHKAEALDRKNELLEQKLRENDALRGEIAATLEEHKRVLEGLAGLTAQEA